MPDAPLRLRLGRGAQLISRGRNSEQRAGSSGVHARGGQRIGIRQAGHVCSGQRQRSGQAGSVDWQPHPAEGGLEHHHGQSIAGLDRAG
ncbi:MAG TPA: hypothetical protein VK009_24920 [Chloroflexota bacterium]|nr:hypothetical protein [Chloroflexota bacterium]